MKNNLSRAGLIGIFLSLCFGCQHAESADVDYYQVLALLETNMGKPYSCTNLQSHKRYVEGTDAYATMTVRGKLLFASDEVSYLFSTILEDEFFLDRSQYVSHDNGLVHTIHQPTFASPMTWECELWEEGNYPLGVDGISPTGGWGVVDQVHALMHSLGEAKTFKDGDLVQMSWKSIPPEVGKDLRSQYRIKDDESVVLNKVRIFVDPTRGIPVSVSVDWGESGSVTNVLEDFVFIEEGLEERFRKLKAKFAALYSFGCKCDFAEPNRIAKPRKPLQR